MAFKARECCINQGAKHNLLPPRSVSRLELHFMQLFKASRWAFFSLPCTSAAFSFCLIQKRSEAVIVHDAASIPSNTICHPGKTALSFSCIEKINFFPSIISANYVDLIFFVEVTRLPIAHLSMAILFKELSVPSSFSQQRYLPGLCAQDTVPGSCMCAQSLTNTEVVAMWHCRYQAICLHTAASDRQVCAQVVGRC